MYRKYISLPILMFFFHINFSYAVLEKNDKNSFIHEDKNFQIHRHVTLSWHSLPNNIISYSNYAIASDSSKLIHDKTLDIDINEVQVIQLCNADHNPYNGMIAYLIKTLCDRWFMKYQIPVVKTVLLVPTVKARQYLSATADIGESSLVHLSAERQINTNAYTPVFTFSGTVKAGDQLAQTASSEAPATQELCLFWANVELKPNSVMRNSSRRTLSFSDLHSRYNIIETAIFQSGNK